MTHEHKELREGSPSLRSGKEPSASSSVRDKNLAYLGALGKTSNVMCITVSRKKKMVIMILVIVIVASY